MVYKYKNTKRLTVRVKVYEKVYDVNTIKNNKHKQTNKINEEAMLDKGKKDECPFSPLFSTLY